MTCDNCGAVFANRYQLGPHRRVCRVTERVTDPIQHLIITEPEPLQHNDLQTEPMQLYELAQRAPGFGEERQLFTNQHAPYNGPRTRSYRELQEIWESMVATTHACVDPRFWKMYKVLLSQTITCRDNVLSVTKQLLLAGNVYLEPKVGTRWPVCNRSLRERVTRKNGGVFWDLVTQNSTIDLKQFNLPGCESVNFEFVDPIWEYIQRCDALQKSGFHLEWKPTSLVNPRNGEELFGAGIQHGLLFRDAAQTIPSNGKVALINLSWDGGNTPYSGRGACPILIQVMHEP